MRNINWFRWACYPVDLAAILYLVIELKVNFFLALALVLVPGFVNYLDGLHRGKNIKKDG